MSKTLLTKWGLKYLSMGWSIIPVKPKSKVPLIPWETYQEKPPTQDEFLGWVEKYGPFMNLGVVTGRISSLVVVDLDGVEGHSYLSTQKLVSPVCQKTGNGQQLFYKWPGQAVPNSVKQIAPGVDIRGDGGFVVVPPSTHPTGRQYQWQRFVPNTMSIFPMEIITAPRALNAPMVATGTPQAKDPDWIAKELEGMTLGNIDNTLFRICSRLRADGYGRDSARLFLAPYAEKAGATPGHLDDKLENVWSRYEPNEKTSGSLSSNTGLYAQSANGLSIHAPSDSDSYKCYEQYLQAISVTEGLKTGFKALDKMLQGGLKSERLFTIAARTGTGKTNWAIALAKALCEQGKKVLFFSTEFRYEKVWERYLASLPRREQFRDHALYVCDSFVPNLGQIEEALRKVEPDVFIFDHINHIGEEREALGTFMQGCNFLQRKYKCQGVMVAQLNRSADWVEGGERVEPRMSMIKGSGTIEQASSRVLLLSETRVTPEYNEIVAVLDKNDSGDRGVFNLALYKNPYALKDL